MSEVKTEREQLEFNVHNAFRELADYFMERGDPLQYEVNRLWRQLDELKRMSDSPKIQQD